MTGKEMINKPTQVHTDAEYEERALLLKHLPRDVLQTMIESRARALDGKWLDQMEQSGVFSLENMLEDITMMDGSIHKRITGNSTSLTVGFPLLCSLGSCLLSSCIEDLSIDPYTGNDIKVKGKAAVSTKVLIPSQEFKDVFGRIVSGFLQGASWDTNNTELEVMAKEITKFKYIEKMENRLINTGAMLTVIASAIGDVKSIKGLTERFTKLEDVVIPCALIGAQKFDSVFNPILSAIEYNRPESLKAFLDAGWSIDKPCKQVNLDDGKLIKYDVLGEIIENINAYGSVVLPSIVEITLNAISNNENYKERVQELALEGMKQRGRDVYIQLLDEKGYLSEYANELSEMAWDCPNFNAIEKIRSGFDWGKIDVSPEQIDNTVKVNPIFNFLKRWVEVGAPGFNEEEMMNKEVSAWLKDCVEQGKGALLAHSSGNALPQLLAETKNYAALITCMDQGADFDMDDNRKMSVMGFAEEDNYLADLIRSYKGKQFAYGVLDEILKENSIQNGDQP